VGAGKFTFCSSTVCLVPELHPPASPGVEIQRSARRRRTISAHRVGDRIVVQVPARMTRAEEALWVEKMVRRVLAGERRRLRSDDDLLARARGLAAAYLDDGPMPAAVRWVDNQQRRWGSCTPEDRSIRMSRRLEVMPDYVIDYVLLHELVHLVEPGHGPQFHALMSRYPQRERAEGYLEAVDAGHAVTGPSGATGPSAATGQSGAPAA
jgi:predicted metal-dependent hydrolase